MLTFEQISKVTGVEKEMLQFLNPSYKLDVIPFIEDEKYSLRLPRNRTGLFVNNEDAIYGYAQALEEEKEKALPQLVQAESTVRYRVRRGDYLGKIAERYGVGVSQIKRWNNLRSNNLRIGQRLIIHPQKNSATAQAGSSPRIYTVKNGDSLWSISKKFSGVTVQQIKSLNNLNSNRLKPGMKLKLSDG